MAENSSVFHVDGEPFEIAARWDESGAVVRVTVEALGREGALTPRLLKQHIRYGSLLNEMRREIVAGLTSESQQAPVQPSKRGEATRADVEAMREPLTSPPGGKRRGPAPTPSALLLRVAGVYRSAVANGDTRPVVAVAEIVGPEQGVEHDAIRQAQSWVKIARRRGYLEPGTSNERRNDG